MVLVPSAASAATQKLAVVRGTRLGPYEVIELLGAGGMGDPLIGVGAERRSDGRGEGALRLRLRVRPKKRTGRAADGERFAGDDARH